MNKTKKYIAMLFTAVLFSVGVPVASSAAEGWLRESEGGTDAVWVYLDEDGNRVVNTWINTDNGCYYLGEDGRMAADALIEHDNGLFYLDKEGVMAVNKWVSLSRAPETSHTPDTFGGDGQGEDPAGMDWYYFGSSGKAFAGMKKRINGNYYIFDGDGRMMRGVSIEQDGETYYVDESGVLAVNRWVLLPGDPTSVEGSGEENPASPAWHYFGSSGKAYKDTKRRIGESSYVFDERGSMITDRLLSFGNDKYYVDENGVLAVNQWVSFPNDPGNEAPCDEPVSTVWYYFGPSGKAFADTKKTIGEHAYIFDEEGHMLSGWQTYGGSSDWYYLGTEDQGFIHRGWQYLEMDDEMDEDTDIDYEPEEWFYLRPEDGKAYRDIKTRIEESFYTFDKNGVMGDRWIFGVPGAPSIPGPINTPVVPGAPDVTATENILDGAAFYGEGQGDRKSGWVYTYGPDDPEERGEKGWYYLDSKGVPFNYGGKDSYLGTKDRWDFCQEIDGFDIAAVYDYAAAKVIRNKTYLFDSNGKMLTGFYFLQGIRCTGGPSALGVAVVVAPDGEFVTGDFYYFEEKEGPALGQMVSGKRKLEMDSGTYHYHFQKNGKVYAGSIVDGYLYGAYGMRADSDEKYSLYEIEGEDMIREKGSSRTYQNCTLIVNSKGKVKRSGTVVIDGTRYTVEHNKVVKEEPAD